MKSFLVVGDSLQAADHNMSQFSLPPMSIDSGKLSQALMLNSTETNINVVS